MQTGHTRKHNLRQWLTPSSALLALLLAAPWAVAAAPGDEWPTLQGNAARTGFTTTTVAPPYAVQWRVQMPGRLPPYSQPIIAGGRVFLGTENNAVFALSVEDGKLLWTFKTDGPFIQSVAVDGDRVFAACHDRRVYALSAADGKELWRFEAQAGFWASPCVADGKVMVGSRDTRFYALDAQTGKPVWTYEAGEQIHQSAACRNGRVTFGTEDGRVHMLDATTGKAVWVSEPFPSISYQYTWPVFAGDTVIYAPIAMTNILGGIHAGFNRDSLAIGWKSARPEDVTHLPPGATDIPLIRRYLDANPDRQCLYQLDVNTGKLRSAVPGFLYMASPQPPPVVSPEGRILFVHSGWYWGETSPAWLAKMTIGPQQTDVKDLFKGGNGSGANTLFSFFPADIYARLTGCGDIVFAVSNSFGGYAYKDHREVPLPREITGLSGSSGVVPAENHLFVVSGGQLVCIRAQGK